MKLGDFLNYAWMVVFVIFCGAVIWEIWVVAPGDQIRNMPAQAIFTLGVVLVYLGIWWACDAANQEKKAKEEDRRLHNV